MSRTLSECPSHHPQLHQRRHHARRPQTPREDPFGPFVEYVTCRLAEDPHLWTRTLCDELEELGYRLSYPTLTRQIRDRKLRPICEACATATDRANAIIDHPPGLQAILHRNLMPRPPVSDLFGAAGRRWLFRQELPEDEHHAIGALLRQLDFLGSELATADRELAIEALADPVVRHLMTIPGVDAVVGLSSASLPSPPALRAHARRGPGYDYNDKQLRRHEREVIEVAERAYETLIAGWQPRRPNHNATAAFRGRFSGS